MLKSSVRSLYHRLQPGVTVGILLAFCVSLVPIPTTELGRSRLSEAGEGAAIKDHSEPFPCQDSPCGCRTAVQCWTSCCCHSASERLAWAKRQGVRPPAYAVKLLKRVGATKIVSPVISETESRAAVRTCCQVRPASSLTSCGKLEQRSSVVAVPRAKAEVDGHHGGCEHAVITVVENVKVEPDSVGSTRPRRWISGSLSSRCRGQHALLITVPWAIAAPRHAPLVESAAPQRRRPAAGDKPQERFESPPVPPPRMSGVNLL